MSRQIPDKSECGACPCGEGKIYHCTSEMDHGWGSESGLGRYEIDCSKCKEIWRVSNSTIIDKASANKCVRLESDRSALRDAISRDAASIVNRYLEAQIRNSKAAEHRELQRLGIFTESIERYRELRKTQSPGIAALASKNPEWLLSQCLPEERAKFEQAFQLLENIGEKIKAAEEASIQRPLVTNHQ